jgi:hypothetical protein
MSRANERGPDRLTHYRDPWRQRFWRNAMLLQQPRHLRISLPPTTPFQLGQ